MKLLAVAIVVLAAVVVAFFMNRLSTRGDPVDDPMTETAGIALEPPADYFMEEGGALSDSEAIERLISIADKNPDRDRFGIAFNHGAREMHLLCDLRTGVILEWTSSGRTRMQTRWTGEVRRRLDYARENGTFSVPGLMPADTRNLYH